MRIVSRRRHLHKIGFPTSCDLPRIYFNFDPLSINPAVRTYRRTDMRIAIDININELLYTIRR